MRKALLASLKRPLQGRGFLLAFLGAALVVLFAAFESFLGAVRSEQLLPYGYHHSLILSALSSQPMALALPILCALPYTAAFLDDVKSGFIKAYLPRTTVTRYITSQALACAISGGLALFMGILVAYGLAALLLLPLEAMRDYLLEPPGYFLQLLETLVMFFASGAFWALVGLTFATLTNSRYMAYASPFVLFYLLVILYERYFDKLYILYPREWLNPSGRWVFGRIGVAVLLLELSALMALLFAWAAKRRLRQI